jgi:hypothetical protein
MLLDVPGTGVEGELPRPETVGGDGEDVGEEFAKGVGDEEEGQGDDRGCGGAEVEEDVEGAGDCTEEEANKPHPDCQGGHVRVVYVGHRGSDLGEGRVLLLDGVKVELHSVFHEGYAL